MITLSAPNFSGYMGQFDTAAAAELKAAWLLNVALDNLVTRESGDGGTTYCYASEADADADRDGAYAVRYSEEEQCDS